MTIAEYCVFSAVIIYLLTLAPAKVIGSPRFNNAKPRDSAFYETPLRARALGAHTNGIETFPFFATAVLLAEFRHSPQTHINELAMAFIVVRLAFVVAYLSNFPTTRTILWNVGFFLNAWLFFLPALST
ncbi:MAG: MAPEG family protein [Rudaea sp.]